MENCRIKYGSLEDHKLSTRGCGSRIAEQLQNRVWDLRGFKDMKTYNQEIIKLSNVGV